MLLNQKSHACRYTFIQRLAATIVTSILLCYASLMFCVYWSVERYTSDNETNVNRKENVQIGTQYTVYACEHIYLLHLPLAYVHRNLSFFSLFYFR